MLCSAKFSSLSNATKKVFQYRTSPISDVLLKQNDYAVLPTFIKYIRNIYYAYIESEYNSWDHQISIHNLNELEKNQAKKLLIKRLNACLLSINKEENPWIIDERDGTGIKIARKYFLENEEIVSRYIEQLLDNDQATGSLKKKALEKKKKYLLDLAALVQFKIVPHKRENKELVFCYTKPTEVLAKFTELINIDEKTILEKIKKFNTIIKKINNGKLRARLHSEPEKIKDPHNLSSWEKTEYFLSSNSLVNFFNTIWNVIAANGTLLKWLIFIGFIFSFAIPTPISCGVILIFSAIYLYFSFKKPNRKIYDLSNLLEEKKQKRIIDFIKEEAINTAQYKKYYSFLEDKLSHLNIQAEQPYKNCYKDPSLIHDNIEESLIYKYFNNTYSKTQFITSLITNLTNTIIYSYAIPLIISTILSAFGLATLASIIASPINIGILILIASSIFLIRHLIQYRAKEDTYQKRIINLLKEPCELTFINSNGIKQQKTLEKWKKIEYLMREIHLLQLDINKITKKNDNLSDKSVFKETLLFFNDYLHSNNKYDYQYETPYKKDNFSIKTLSCFFYFLVGGSTGFSLVRSIFPNIISLDIIFKSLTLVLFIAIPLIIVTGIVNLIIYRLSTRQHRLLFSAEHLDNKLQTLESRRNVVSCLAATLKTLADRSENTNTIEHSLHTLPKNKRIDFHFPFRKTNSKYNHNSPVIFFKHSESISPSSAVTESATFRFRQG